MSQTATTRDSSQAGEKAKEVAGQAQEQASQVADKARSSVRDQVDQRSTQAGEQISTQASDVRTVAEELRKQGKEGPAKVAEQAADRAQRVGSWLTESDGDRILRDAEDFGRRNPWAVAAGGLLLGFAASRMLKASSQERFESSRIQSGYGAPAADRPAIEPPVRADGNISGSGV
jgi:hypothetical protein